MVEKSAESLLNQRAEIYNSILAIKALPGWTAAPIKFEKRSENDVSELVTSAKADAMLKILKPYLGDAIFKVPGIQEYHVVIAHKHLTEENVAAMILRRALICATFSPLIDIDKEIQCLDQIKSLLTLLPNYVENLEDIESLEDISDFNRKNF